MMETLAPEDALAMSSQPCPTCDEARQRAAQLHAELDPTLLRLTNFIDLNVTTQLNLALSEIVSGRQDPVIAVLIMSRELHRIAEIMEGCEVCRGDITMAKEFDQHMIAAKHARLNFARGHHWQAAMLYAKFQWSIFRGVNKWVIKPAMRRILEVHTGSEHD